MQSDKTRELVLTGLFVAIIIIMAFTPLGYIPLGVINATIIHIPVILGALFCGPKKGAFLGFVFGVTSFIKNTFMPSTLSAFVFSPVLAASMIGTSGVIKSAFICFVPRILVGVVPYFVYIGVRKVVNSEHAKVGCAILNVLIGLFLFIGVRAFLIEIVSSESFGIAATIIGLIAGVIVFILFTIQTNKKNASVLAFVYAAVAGAMTNTILVMGSILLLYRDAYAEAIGVSGEAVVSVIAGVISFNGVVEAIVAAIIVAALGVVLKKLKPID